MIEKLTFGRTGHLSTRTLFGAAAFGTVTQVEANRSMEQLLRYGVNHIDTAASYGDAELRIGPWLEKHRAEFFLATKTGDRKYAEARDSIHRSLERLRTDHLDLLQLHAVVEDSEWEEATGPGGALEAAIEAREQGLVRFIGITSHSLHAPVIHIKSLERFDFDSVLLPYNYMLAQNPRYLADFNELAAICRARNVAMQLIKTLERRPWGERVHRYDTWYEPFDEPHAVDLAIHYALSRPGMFINTAGDIHVLPMILDAASRYAGAPSDAAMQELVRDQGAEPLWVA
jgi:aryl-alcohol dehydrogenase-like predicted oxidoreductase